MIKPQSSLRPRGPVDSYRDNPALRAPTPEKPGSRLGGMYRSNTGLMPGRPLQVPQAPRSALAPKGPRGAFDTGIAPRPTLGLGPKPPKLPKDNSTNYARGNVHTAASRFQRKEMLAEKRKTRAAAKMHEAQGGIFDGRDKEDYGDPTKRAYNREIAQAIQNRERKIANLHPSRMDDPERAASPLDRFPKPGSSLRRSRSV